MIEYEALRAEIDRYLMGRFKYRKPLIYLTVDNIIATRRNSCIDLYLRIRKIESLFSPDCLIIADRDSVKANRTRYALSPVHGKVALKYDRDR